MTGGDLQEIKVQIVHVWGKGDIYYISPVEGSEELHKGMTGGDLQEIKVQIVHVWGKVNIYYISPAEGSKELHKGMTGGIPQYPYPYTR